MRIRRVTERIAGNAHSDPIIAHNRGFSFQVPKKPFLLFVLHYRPFLKLLYYLFRE